MKTQKELENMFGISRKTLRYYDQIGLLVPASRERNENDKVIHMSYADDAVNLLSAIQVYIRAGYSCQEVKKIFEIKSEDELIAKNDEAIHRLEEKRKEIDKNIALLNQMKAQAMLPAALDNILPKEFLEKSLKASDTNFNNVIRDYSESLISEDDKYKELFTMFAPIEAAIIAIACYCRYAVADSGEIQDCVKGTVTGFSMIWDVANGHAPREKIKTSIYIKRAITLTAIIKESLCNPEAKQFMEDTCGPSSVEFLLDAFFVNGKELDDDFERKVELKMAELQKSQKDERNE